jgi:hypothetical protein
MSTISEENNNMIQITKENSNNDTRALFLDRRQAANVLAEKLRSLTEMEVSFILKNIHHAKCSVIIVR